MCICTMQSLLFINTHVVLSFYTCFAGGQQATDIYVCFDVSLLINAFCYPVSCLYTFRGWSTDIGCCYVTTLY